MDGESEDGNSVFCDNMGDT